MNTADLAGSGLKAQIYYANGNQTLGNIALVTSDAIAWAWNDFAFRCIPGNDIRVFCIWLNNAGVLKFSYFDGVSWSSPTTVAYPGSISGMFGITKSNGNNALLVSRLSGSLIKWNKTDSAGTSFISSGSFFLGSQQSPNYMAVSIRPNLTGYVGIAWANCSSPCSTKNIYFTTFQAFQWGPDIAVMNTGGFERETHIAVSPVSNTLVAVAINHTAAQAQPPTPPINRCATRRSSNAGDIWSDSSQLPFALSPNGNQSDPVVAARSNGEFVAICLEIRGSNKAVFTSTSQDDGRSWGSPQIVASSSNPSIDLDKPWIVADYNKTSPFKDYVYACWTRNDLTTSPSRSEIVFKRVGPNPLPEKVLFTTGTRPLMG